MKEYKKELLGFTAGNFDLLHPGYINCFKDAKNYCDKFIVFLQIDPSLHRKSKYKDSRMQRLYLLGYQKLIFFFLLS